MRPHASATAVLPTPVPAPPSSQPPAFLLKPRNLHHAYDAYAHPGPEPHRHPHMHELARRHYYTCGSETFSWRPSWYIAAFYTASSASYDSAASDGPINPPTSVIDSIPACSAVLSVASSYSAAVSSGIAGAPTAMGSEAGAATTTATATETGAQGSSGRSGSTSGSESGSGSGGALQTLTASETSTSGQVVTSRSDETIAQTTVSSAYVTTFLTTSASTSLASLSTGPSLSSAGWSSASAMSSSSLASPSATALGASDPLSTNACAGEWDLQAWGAVSGLGAGLIVGGLLWLVWGLLRNRVPGLYSPRVWYISPEWTWLAFVLPFLHLPSPTSGAQSPTSSLLFPVFAALKLASLGSLLALAAALPIIIATVPCQSQTSPPNTLGGRLGSLTVRLLNALDPSPGSPSTPASLKLLFQTSGRRALSSTIGPAISSARTRLILLLVLIGLFALVGGLWVVARTYAGSAQYRSHFAETTCGGMDMIFVDATDAPGWEGLSEERIRKRFRESAAGDSTEGERQELDVIGVFAVPDTCDLRAKIDERRVVLDKLEVAETRYIESFRLAPTSSNGRRLEHMRRLSRTRDPEHPEKQPWRSNRPLETTSLREVCQARRIGIALISAFYKLGSVSRKTAPQGLDVRLPASLATAGTSTKFHEINRDSTLYGGKRFDIGQAIKVDPQGQYIPDPSPDSEGHPLGSGSAESIEPDNPAEQPPPDGGDGSSARQSGDMTRATMTRSLIGNDIPPIRPGPARRPELVTPPISHVLTAHPSRNPSHTSSEHVESPVGQAYAHIARHRTEYKALNDKILALQEKAFAQIRGGGKAFGWIVIGKGVTWLPGVETVEGRTREDILWRNAGKRSRLNRFRIEVGVLGAVLAIIMVPFIGLTEGTAPGFAHYLGLMGPLERNDGFGAGVGEGLAPGIALCLAVAVAVIGSEVLASRVKCISVARRATLAYKATFWLLLSICIFWLVAISSLEFAVQAFASQVQEARSVGDGSIYSIWWIFVFLLNTAFVIPAIYLLQPKHLVRYFLTRRRAITPRQRFRARTPPTFSPAFFLAGPLLAVFYAESLIFLYPLLAIPLFLLLYLSFVAVQHMREYVFVESSFSDGTLAMWTIRRFGWCLGIQPLVYGLIMLSRKEWALGGVSVTVAVLATGLAEVLTARRFPPPRRRRLSAHTRRKLDDIGRWMRTRQAESASSRPRISDVSILQRVTALLPGFSRMPESCPLPLVVEVIDDLAQTERTANTRPGYEAPRDARYFHDPNDANRGLVYPDEMLVPVPVIWLPNDRAGVAEAEAGDLEGLHGLAAIVDPAEGEETGLTSKRRGRSVGDERERRGREAEDEGGDQAEGEVSSPLLDD